ncbi:M20/M25/M40 family metallo-hydrolase [Phytohabitans sp. ZYX-F-186]|uniref:M20/M25/M40 family metallo-hydrolase n=1 Tax=Phytohabitans maris TaxID=3071409 RepID=A0ABU0ZWP0_9ACTN|nr:M20/M25/M40 family metallo-hydrolase [Phytohabitans sp. ZYX-F-186]MDQ7911226.1 M20/M25/M40 family metallo-hydrolase [Phytohabitans sp. ZYX-F-186]
MNLDRWLPELVELVEIPSVGADPAHAADMVRAVDWLRTRLEAVGAATRVLREGRESVLLADVPAQRFTQTAPTILIYGHFDVQPPGPAELWTSPAFAPRIRDGWLYGRGTVDDKGHLLMYLAALRSLVAAGRLGVNVRLLLDGAEESGGVLALKTLREMADRPDGCLIFDGPMIAKGRPAFYEAARGMAFFRLHLRTGRRDLHSGQFGGAAMNAVHVLVRVLDAVLPGPDGRLPDPLRVGAVPLPRETAERLSLLPTAADLLGGEGAHPADGYVAEDLYTRLWAEPSLDVNGVAAGEPLLHHMQIPCTARASLSIRLAPGQRLEPIAGEVCRLLRAAVPAGAELEIERVGSSPPSLLPAEGAILAAARAAFTDALGAAPLTIRAGGTLPLLSVLGELGIPTVMTGLDLPEGNIHAPDERLWLEHLPVGTAILEDLLGGTRFTQ